MNNKIRVGVIGLGMGYSHARAFRNNPDAELVALCDTDEVRLKKVSDEFGINNRFSNYSTLIESGICDAVSVATPNKFHAEITISALKQGMHVLCEKPMALSTAEALSMKAAAESAKKNLMINFSYRYTPVSKALKSQVDNGILGDIYFGRTVWHRRRGIPGFGGWFCDKELAGGGPLIDLGVHRIDLALWLMGYPEPVTVSSAVYNGLAVEMARRAEKKYSVEDLACALVRFDNGASLIIEASWALNIGEPEHMVTSLYGRKGGLVQKNTDGGYNFTGEIYTEESGVLYTKKIDSTAQKVNSSYDEFISSIREGRTPEASADQGIKVMRILDAVYESAAQSAEIVVIDKCRDLIVETPC